MKERPKTGAFLIIAIALLCVYLTRTRLLTPFALSEALKTISTPQTAGARLVLGSSIDINSAGASDLALLPGIGSILAQRIVESRRKRGAYHSIDDLRRVKGLSSSRVKALRTYLTVLSP